MTNSTNTNFDILVVVPHLSDALLSLGQHLHNWRQQGRKVTIITVFNSFGSEELMSENAWDYILHSGTKNVKEFSSLMAKREQSLQKDLGVEVIPLNYVDSAFRRYSNISVYASRRSLTAGRLSTFDSSLPAKIFTDLSQLVANNYLFPYGVGGFVDNVALSLVGAMFQKRGIKVDYYLENPYLWQKLNYLKFSPHILRAKSYLNKIDNKNLLLKKHPILQPPFDLSREKFPEVII
jgi:hypothetical protein